MNINESGAYDRDVEKNWAAAYAKRLVDQEANERDQAITAAVGDEEAARVASDNAIKDGTALEDKCIKTRHINPGNITNGCIHDYDVTEVKLATDSVTTEKIKNLNVTEAKLANKSVSSGKIQDYAVTNIKLESDVFATVQETRWGDDTRKAVTPNGLKQGVGYLIPASVSSGDFAMNNIPCSSIDADVTSIFHNPVRDAGLREYSETPVQVGTWIDGTPVWRAVIDHTLTSVDEEDACHNALDDITNVRADVKLVLEGRAVLTGESPSCIDYVNCVLEPDGTFGWDAAQQSGSGFTHLVGCIVFVTEASNISA